MSKAKILSATLVAGLTASSALGANTSDDDLIAVAPGSADDALITQDFEMHGDIPVAPAAVHPADDHEIRIDYAQTYWGGESNDAVQGVTGNGKSKKKKNQAITLDNGIKKKGKLKTQQGGLKKKKKKN